jgi:hypothetical protein
MKDRCDIAVERPAGISRRAFLPALAGLAAGSWACRRTGPRPAAGAMDETPGFWVWHRSSALSPREHSALPKGARLYRQVAEFGWRGGKWSPREVAKAAVIPAEVIPVVRIDPGPAFLERADAAEMLTRWLRHHFAPGVPSRLQLDHDCPVRLLPRYAGFLRELRGSLALRELSITALAGWVGSPRFDELGRAVDEMVPMFYDLTADAPADIAAGKALPMAGAEAAGWIERWKSCRTPWRAGLANFERLTLFEADGRLVGHLKQWSPESLQGVEFLEPLPDFAGAAGYRVTRAAVLHGTRLGAGQLLVWRAPEDAALRDLIAAARGAGARGIVWFALAGPGLRAARSPAHLAALAGGRVPLPDIRLRRESDGRLVLRNEGPGDLAALPGAPLHHLKIVADQAGGFGDVGPGGFAALRSSLPVKFSRDLLLSFPRLLVAEEIASEPGLIPAQGDTTFSWALDDSAFAPLP